MVQPDHILFDLASKATALALSCLATGETLLPFLITEGDPGAIISIDVEGFEEVLLVAQDKVNGFGEETSSFAFSYDGFLTLEGVRYDAIYVETGHAGFSEVRLFAQCYQAGVSEDMAPKIGDLIALLHRPPLLKPQSEQGCGGNSAALRASP